MITRIFYNFSLFILMLFFFPKILWQFLIHRKYRENLWTRFKGKKRFNPPKDAPVIWLHAVSVGESKALSALTPHIRKSYPNAFILVSTVTETGQQEAQKLIKEADAFCYLPLDFSWIIRRFVRDLRPNLLVLVEGDFWYNLLSEVKKGGGAVVLVNGKLSERSLRRYFLFKSFFQGLFQKIDSYIVQSETYLERFMKLGVDPEKITVLDNLKYDIPSPEISLDALQKWRDELGVNPEDRIITVGSTHEKEESLLLDELAPLWKQFPHFKLFLAPRHPHRFRHVEKLLQERKLSYVMSSKPEGRRGDEKIILVDQMGVLSHCYQISQLAIVGGSFVQGIGGHDIFEPAKMGVPVLFGPYMHKQEELSCMLSREGAGKEIKPGTLPQILKDYFSSPPLLAEAGQKGKSLAQKMAGTSFRTWKQIEPFLQA